MSTPETMDMDEVRSLTEGEYKYGFVTDVEVDTIPKGLSEDVVRLISDKKDEPKWLLDWRLEAYAKWLEMEGQGEPDWARVSHPPIDFQDIRYYAAPKSQADAPKSLDEVD
ncbi:MAG: Fe-S cluster assembly protein SufB, partial [Alphaproteobacteria bacterium]|nr:Fe-S cluster assembly protein SufB [Alphaproteobacteria bacterium]